MKFKLKIHENKSKCDLKVLNKLNQIILKHLLNLTEIKKIVNPN